MKKFWAHNCKYSCLHIKKKRGKREQNEKNLCCLPDPENAPPKFFCMNLIILKILNIQKSLLILLSWEKKVFNFKNASEKTS